MAYYYVILRGQLTC